jgi:hypothetical protein
VVSDGGVQEEVAIQIPNSYQGNQPESYGYWIRTNNQVKYMDTEFYFTIIFGSA